MISIPLFLQPLLVFLYLLVCFLAVAPIFLQKNGPTPISSMLTATCLGVMLSGFLYVVSILIGIPNMLPTILIGLALALSNSVMYREQLRISMSIKWTSLISNYSCYDFFYFIIFVFYGGFILVGTLKMGFGDFPFIFFNMDTPLRLSQAHALVSSAVYPPESLMIKGMIHSYHYGAPATVAAIARVTDLAVHKVMFWIVVPLFLLSSYAVFVSIVRIVIKNPFKRIVGLIFVIPLTFLGNFTYQFFLGGNLWNALLTGVVGSTLEGTYNPELFTRGIADISVVSGFFLLGAAALLCVEKNAGRVLALVPILGILTIFMKMNLAPAVYSMLGIALLMTWSRVREPLFFGSLVLLTALPVVLLVVLGYGHTSSETSLLTVRSLDDIFDFFDGTKGSTHYYLREMIICAVIGIPVFIFWLFRRDSYNAQQSSRLLISALGMMLISWTVVAAFYIPKVGIQFATPLWLGLPLVCIALLGIEMRQIRILQFLLLTPFFLAALIGQWAKLNHMSVAVVLPEHVAEFADNRLLGEALSYVPTRFTESDPLIYSSYVNRYPDLLAAFESRPVKEQFKTKWGKAHYDRSGKIEGRIFDDGASYVDRYPDLLAAFESRPVKEQFKTKWGKAHYDRSGKIEGRILVEGKPLLVTNDFRYISWPDSQPQIPALFGHRAYGVHLRHFPGPRGFNREGERRIGHQLRRLSRSFSRKNMDFSAETLKQARNSGWTHFLLRKDVDDNLPPINADDIPLKKLFENDRYAIFDFRVDNL